MAWVSFSRQPEESAPEDEVAALWREYLVDELGIPSDRAEPRILAEARGDLHCGLLASLEQQGWVFEGSVVLDVGCGTGALASALADKGARILGIEPSRSWASAAHRRVAQKKETYGQIICGSGGRLPFAANSVDYVMSLQVLEHVPMALARNILHEIARVLRPGGRVYLAFEDYLTFWEPHYRVRWLPFLPKRVGVLYLGFIGRNPTFLREHIYYNPAIVLAKTCWDAGLIREPWTRLECKLRNPSSFVGISPKRAIAQLASLMPSSLLRLLVIGFIERRQLISTTFRIELMDGRTSGAGL